MMRKLLLFCYLLGLLSACKEEFIEADPDVFSLGKVYYPLAVGRYVEYAVTKVEHRELVDDKRSTYYLRQTVIGLDNSEQYPVYRLEVASRPNLTAKWQVDSVWTVRDEGNKFVQTESNVPFIKLSFPLLEALTWDGNSYNTHGTEEYTALQVGFPYTVAGQTFENTATIQQNNSYTLIDKDLREEVYASNVGLIYKKKETYRYINDSQSPFYAKDSIIGGLFYEQVLVDYGE